MLDPTTHTFIHMMCSNFGWFCMDAIQLTKGASIVRPK